MTVIEENIRSLRGFCWQLRCQDESAVRTFEQATGVDNLLARLLVGRGVDVATTKDFLRPRIKDFLPDPSCLQDMDKAADLIMDAVLQGQKVTVLADYDVDGASSAAQLIRWARALGATFELYVPDRVTEGYGPSVEIFERLKAAENALVITVDCGATAHQALQRAQSLELPIIVIDHHLMTEDMPPAAALVNPNRPDDKSGLGFLAAAGVSFMLLVALNRRARDCGYTDLPDLFDFLGLTALGTICDVMPLTGLNRAFVHQGLKILSQRELPGVAALSEVTGLSGAIESYHVGFILGPRLNAGGRLGQADVSARLLSTDNMVEALEYARYLDEINDQRKHLQAQTLDAAVEHALPQIEYPVCVVAMSGWHPGVIGIVAGRLKERLNVPVVVIAIDDAGLGRGSGRSLGGVNLGAAISAAKAHGLLLSGGGHAMAGGLLIEVGKIEALRNFLCTRLEADVRTAQANMVLQLDSWLSPQAIAVPLIEVLGRLAPYGEGNPQAVFGLAHMRVCYAQRLSGGHVRCTFEDKGGERVHGICFQAEENGLDDILLSDRNQCLHIAGHIKKNIWKGRMRLDFHVRDIALAEVGRR